MIDLKGVIRDNGMRLTAQRRIVLDELRKFKTHPRADEVYDKVRVKMPKMSIATVYRNLNVLVDLGLVNEVKDKNSTRFDSILEQHYHFNCEKCNRIIDIDIPVNKALNKEVEKETGYAVRNHMIEFSGLCDSCRG